MLTIKPMLFTAFVLTSSCAGPSSPLGASWSLSPSSLRTRFEAAQEGEAAHPKISFLPAKQVLHGPTLLRIIVSDELRKPDPPLLKISYDDLDISQSFLLRSHIAYDSSAHQLVFEYPGLKLSPDQDHHIEVLYKDASGKISRSSYDAPSCNAFDKKQILWLGEFSPPASMIRLIATVSEELGLNPSFSAALVAQESGFNPRAVSWAKAVGLTQVTPIAEEELVRENADWPRYPGLNELPVPMLKALILTREINEKNEWRLNQKQSLEGGLKYALTLSKKWSSLSGAPIRKIANLDPDTEKSRLILASYHSGYARVASAVNRDGPSWLTDADLTEARKYVNRIVVVPRIKRVLIPNTFLS